jgi:ArsR family transcriptional regulator, arsenate/arsenite/antimonite-responsive transcriptional repressor
MRMSGGYGQLLISVKPYILSGMPTRKNAFSLARFFRALADRTRLRVLNLIADREICVCYFVEILGMSQPKISRHLAYLRRAGIVSARRQGRWMHYRLVVPADAAAAAILKETMSHLRQTPEMERDLARLEKRCCSPDSSEPSRPTPQPLLLSSAAK